MSATQTAVASAVKTMHPMDSFAALFEESESRQEMRVGEMITAEVVSVDQNIVVVNAGLKSESVIPVEEFKNDKGELEVKVGDFVTVAIEQIDDGYGATKLSRDRAKKLSAWHDLDVALDKGTIITGMVSGKVKGGLTVMVNGHHFGGNHFAFAHLLTRQAFFKKRGETFHRDDGVGLG